GVDEERLHLAKGWIGPWHRPHLNDAVIGGAGDVVAPRIDAGHHIGVGLERAGPIQFLFATGGALPPDVDPERAVAADADVEAAGKFVEVLTFERGMEPAV